MSCEKAPGSSECRTSLLSYLASDETWEPLASNYRQAVESFGAPPLIEFVTDPTRSGSTVLQIVESKLKPVVRLGIEADPLETLITLNHEMHHAVSLATRKQFLDDALKLEGCVTKYKLMTLEDEEPAFRSEIQFWKQASTKFRDHFKSKEFPSRLIGATGNYEAYYQKLEVLMAREPQFIPQRYVEMEQYPSCVLPLIKR